MCTLKPLLVDSPNKEHLLLIGQHEHSQIELFNTNKPPNKGHIYLKDNTECTNVSVIEWFYLLALV